MMNKSVEQSNIMNTSVEQSNLKKPMKIFVCGTVQHDEQVCGTVQHREFEKYLSVEQSHVVNKRNICTKSSSQL
jgi:hypothetical protein